MYWMGKRIRAPGKASYKTGKCCEIWQSSKRDSCTQATENKSVDSNGTDIHALGL